MTQRDPAVAVVGAGMSGLCVAIALLRSGTYPGLVCDIPSPAEHLR